MSEMVWTFPGGRLIDNFATLGAVSTVSFTVPARKRWIFICGYAEIDTNATFDGAIYNSANKMIQSLISKGAATTNLSIPYNDNGARSFYFLPLKAGDYVKFDWGVAQTSPEVSCVVLEVEA